MLSVYLTALEVNLLLRDIEGWRFEQGVFLGRVKLPLGAVRLVVIPAQQGDFLVLSIPFDQVKGDITGGLFGQVVKMLWKVIQDQVTKRVVKILDQQGLPRDTVVLEQRKDAHGSLGVVLISLQRVNQWIARYPVVGKLRSYLAQVAFDAGGVSARLGLYQP